VVTTSKPVGVADLTSAEAGPATAKTKASGTKPLIRIASALRLRRQPPPVRKFLGDGFMAIFGAPLEDPAAAHHAVAAAQEILVEIDRRDLADGAWPLRVGIGLHIGDAVTGNVGSPRRKEFTAIGDTVNLASRLEQLTKEHNARLIVSDAIVAAIGNAAGTATKLGAATVKGYAEPVNIWRLG
jgi:adenylate cyclase